MSFFPVAVSSFSAAGSTEERPLGKQLDWDESVPRACLLGCVLPSSGLASLAPHYLLAVALLGSLKLESLWFLNAFLVSSLPLCLDLQNFR